MFLLVQYLPFVKIFWKSLPLQLVKRHSLLSCRQGRGRAAKRKMVESNLMLVHSVAQQFHGRGLSHDDLYQQGVLGLLKSTEKFDSTRSTKFSSYAFFGVQNQMRIAAEKFGHALRIGQTVYTNVSSLLRHKHDFVVQHGRQPTFDELVEVSNVSAKKIRQWFKVLSPVKSLDASGPCPWTNSPLFSLPQHRNGNHIAKTVVRAVFIYP